jgi:hypothetical protein
VSSEGLARGAGELSCADFGRKDRWHSIMDLGHQIVPVGGDTRECPDPLTGCRVLPVFP